MNLKNSIFSLLAFALLLSTACSPKEQNRTAQEEEKISDKQARLEADTVPPPKAPEDQEPEFITVLVIPCANSYDYEGSDLNPSLLKYLAADPRVKVIPFSLKKMQGLNYMGVYTKKDCLPILEREKADFFIMTRMHGKNTLEPQGGKQDISWGYDTKVLNTATMEEFDGISGMGLSSFRKIDGDIKSKITILIEDMIRSKSPVQVSR